MLVRSERRADERVTREKAQRIEGASCEPRKTCSFAIRAVRQRFRPGRSTSRAGTERSPILSRSQPCHRARRIETRRSGRVPKEIGADHSIRRVHEIDVRLPTKGARSLLRCKSELYRILRQSKRTLLGVEHWSTAPNVDDSEMTALDSKPRHAPEFADLLASRDSPRPTYGKACPFSVSDWDKPRSGDCLSAHPFRPRA